MINFLKSWCEGIIVAIILSIIIESLLPEGNNKKYVKVVIGIYILFVVLNPIIQILNYDINFDSLFNFKSMSTSATIDNNIKNVYIKGMEETLKEEIEKLGFNVLNIKIIVDDNYENIEKIEVIIGKNNISNIEPVLINKDNLTDSSNNFMELKNYISSNYNIEVSKIIIKS